MTLRTLSAIAFVAGWWVAQRFPVRARLEKPPQQLMRLGASAVVEIKHGTSCH
jgi:multidrug resistance efflux pump